jgi:hypothetical protein
MKQADVKGFTDRYQVYASMKKQGRLFPGDKEPDPKDYGLIPWAADHIKKRIDREVSR